MYKTIAGLVVLLVIVVGAILFFKNTAKAPGESAPVGQASAKTYTNERFHYSFSYPDAWALEPEQNIIDTNNAILSIVSVYELASTSPHRFGVTVNQVERTIKNHASTTEPMVIGGVQATAYFFPDGYGCTPSEQDPDCSFFLIPIKRNGVWYEITAANSAKTLDYYRPILASFQFTN